MKVEINVTFSYKQYCIVFAKMFGFDFAPFYDMVLRDSREDSSLRLILTNQGTTQTEIIYNKDSPDFIVNTTIIWDVPFHATILDSVIGSYIGCGWQRTDSYSIEDIKKKMQEDTAMTEAYNAPVGRKA